MTEKVSMGIVLQMVQQNDDKHEKGHARLRDDWRDLEQRVMALERAYTDALLDFTRTKTALEEKAKAPVEITRIRLSLQLAIALIVAVLTMAGAAWSSAAWVKSDVQAMRVDVTSLRGEFALETRLNDERNQAMLKSIEELRKRQELVELEIRNQKRGR
jgi:hypothetical protein